VLRPGDANEVVEAYRYIMQLRHEPAVLALSRQPLPTLDRKKYAAASGVARGAYILGEAPGSPAKAPDVILIATGSEVCLAVEAHEKLLAAGIRSRVVSMPSWDIFEHQSNEYRDSVLPPTVSARVAIEETLHRQRLLRDGLRTKKLRLKWHEAQLSFLEGVFARGDRRLGAVLEKAVDLGCRFDGWRDHFDFDRWQRAFAAAGLEPAWYLRQRAEDETLPWDHIDCGSPKAFFLRERHLALEGRYTPDCRGGECSGCGVCDFEELRMRLTTHGELPLPAQPPAAPPGDEERYKVRLQLRKDGKARFVSHLEFMTVVHRAARRGGIPVRFSGGFHPQPRVSFPDALPLGVESDAEILDFELFRPWSAREVAEALNAQLPEGFRVLEAAALHWQTPAPSVSIKEVVYRVELPNEAPADLTERLASFLAADQVPVTREKEGKSVEVDLRQDVLDLEVDAGALWLTVAKGSPVRLAAHLLGLAPEAARELRIRKTAVVLG
jgi:radical SAM-linked protein